MQITAPIDFLLSPTGKKLKRRGTHQSIPRLVFWYVLARSAPHQSYCFILLYHTLAMKSIEILMNRIKDSLFVSLRPLSVWEGQNLKESGFRNKN